MKLILFSLSFALCIGNLSAQSFRFKNHCHKNNTTSSFLMKSKDGRDTAIDGIIAFVRQRQFIFHKDTTGSPTYFPLKDVEEITAYTDNEVFQGVYHHDYWLFKIMEGKIKVLNYCPGYSTKSSFIQKDQGEIKPYDLELLGRYLVDNSTAYKIYRKAKINYFIGKSMTIGGFGLAGVTGAIAIYATRDGALREMAKVNLGLALLGTIIATGGLKITISTKAQFRRAINEYNK